MKTLQIDWTPSPEVMAKAKLIYELHKEGDKTLRQIAAEMGYTRQYVTNLKTMWQKELKHES